MKYLQTYESLEEELEKAKSFSLVAGDYLVCVFSDHEEFDYGKSYKIKEISASKLTISVFGNSGKRYFFQNGIEDNNIVSKTIRDIKDGNYEILFTILLYPGTLEDYLDRIEANKYNL